MTTVFEMRDDLAHIHQLARAKRVGPDALLALTIVRVLAATEPTLTTDIGVGGRGSLNYLVALCGPSGGGKGIAEATAAEHIIVNDHRGRPVETPTVPFGSGEGMATFYRPRGTDDDEPHARTRAVFSASEIDKFAALTSRTGSTLAATLREAWMGEMLGAQNADSGNSTNVPRHTYRWCAVLGVQPRRAGALLGDADGGTPQRVLWAPVGDPGAPRDKPADPGPLTVTLPDFKTSPTIHVNPNITAGYDEMQQDRLHTGLDGDDIDGHTRLTQLKTAAALALMAGRTVIGVDDWTIAEHIINRSVATRDQVQAILTADSRKAALRRAEERAEVSMHSDDHREREGFQRVRDRLVAHVRRHGPRDKADLRRAVRHNLRDHFEPALSDLILSDIFVPTGDERFDLREGS